MSAAPLVPLLRLSGGEGPRERRDLLSCHRSSIQPPSLAEEAKGVPNIIFGNAQGNDSDLIQANGRPLFPRGDWPQSKRPGLSAASNSVSLLVMTVLEIKEQISRLTKHERQE